MSYKGTSKKFFKIKIEMGLKMIHQIKLSMIIKKFKSKRNMSIKSINKSKMMSIIGILEIQAKIHNVLKKRKKISLTNMTMKQVPTKVQ